MKELFSGISLEKQDDYSVCHVVELSDEIKDLIRKNFSSICHGAAVVEDVDPEDYGDIYSYYSTIESFLDRYNKKSEATQKGIVGELLAHIILTEVLGDFDVVSAFFNQEEKSIKKGFDLILAKPSAGSVWITEVKSGTLHKDKNVDQTTAEFLGLAKNDLKKRLNEQEKMYWYNAVSSVRNAVAEDKDFKKALVRILKDSGKATTTGQATSKDHCVILVSNIFESLKNKITNKPAKKCLADLKKAGTFSDTIVVNIQKSTFSKVVDFLQSELTAKGN
ncbi:Hachiman antiphage defense system protein HamA [Halodesulfovibrio sp. MK-HDV]|jgi:uncharacterized protein DUF1837|uniref:Hachiman antiphage defense system protein HamA n=1 Tax=Halodesulfovibrio sp. MK-HDV TaxID=2599925 RepID=UPI00136D94E5|nr:Hachiman antiphage defense system protein HamA [Halodesulfovibrio sp. MK-HDV]KAF1075459.1 hypothetical protein MKHDV_01907 [Halodesulfovibrio sp. MK-HDV]